MKLDIPVSKHGGYNGWCRVVGIPLKAKDCPECLKAMAYDAAEALENAAIDLRIDFREEAADAAEQAAMNLRGSAPVIWIDEWPAVAIRIGRLTFDSIGSKPLRCGIHGTVIEDRRCATCDEELP